MKKFYLMLLAACLCAMLATLGVMADSFGEVEKNISEFTLSNGIKVIVMERHNAPVVSFITYFDVGASNEVKGITGIAHVFEHMAFKGTEDIGTTDYKKEKMVLDQMDDVFMKIVAEKKKITGPDPATLKKLNAELADLQQQAAKYVVNNEFSQIVDRNGGVGTNAGTSADSTMYMINLPSNRLELWAWLESERIMHPVLREFYKEKNVIKEERRLRTESNPIGRLIEEVTVTAFKAHPYGEPIIGHMSDIETESRRDAIAFHKKYYVGNNITIAIVGDVYPKEVKPIVEKYLGKIPAGEKAGRVTTVEPPQVGEKRIIIRDPSQPVVIMAFHKPDIRDKDAAVYDVIQDILSGGKSARLNTKLVKEEKIALAVGAFPGYPGNKYPNLFLFFGLPNSGHTTEQIENGIWDELERLKSEPVSDEELSAVVTKARAGLYNQLLSNFGMARQLASEEALTGNWQNLFKHIQALQAVSKDDIMRVAKQCFVRSNMTVGTIVHEAAKSEN